MPPSDLRSRIREIDHLQPLTTGVQLERVPRSVNPLVSDVDAKYLELIAAGIRDLGTIITQRKRLYTDSLTGLSTVYALEDRLGEYMFEASHDGRPLLVSLIDLDNLKAVNDTVGHTKGNEYLRLAADAMKNSVRSTDDIFRVGGDEFVVIGRMPEGSVETPQDQLQQNFRDRLTVNMQAAVEGSELAAFRMDAVERVFALSAGQVVWDPNEETFEEAFNRVDDAMYQHKAGKANR